MKNKDFDCVAWVRQVRDENYKKYGHLPMKEFAEIIISEGKNTELYKSLY